MKHPQTNPRNDRLKRDYLIYLKEAKQRSTATMEQARRAIDRLETYTAFKDFGTFNKEQAIGFKKALLLSKARATGNPISHSTAHHILQAIKDFLGWLHARPGFHRHINLNDIAYLNLTTSEVRAAHAPRQKPYPSLEQIRAVLDAMPTETEVQKRDRAVIAFILLTGVRDAALISLKLKHIDLEQQLLFQDAREVKTKFAKTIETWFFPVGDEATAIVTGWVLYLREEKLYSPNDPLFPKTMLALDAEKNFAPAGLGKEHWANAAPVRDIFKAGFKAAGLPYFNPHSLRNTLTQLAYQRKLDPEQLKAWSENLGHESVMTTLGSYGHLARERKKDIMEGLRSTPLTAQPDTAAQIAEMYAMLKAKT